MVNKYRVHEVAKDLGVNSKEVLELLSKYFEDPKKHMTALTEEELDVVFEHYTQNHQAKSIDEIESQRVNQKAVQKEEKPAAQSEKPAVKPEKSAEKPVTLAEKTEKAVSESAKPEKPATKPEKTAAKQEKPAAKQEKPAEKQAEQAESAPRNPQGNPSRPQGQNRDRNQNRNQGQNRDQDRAQNQDRQSRTAQNQNRDQNRPQNQERQNRFPQGQNRPQQDKERFDRGRVQSQERLNQSRQQNQERQNRPQQAQNKPAQNAAASRPLVSSGKTVTTVDTTGNKIVRHVDMRAATVELEKYNEKYEQIAPAAAMNDTHLHKQKFGQRPQRRQQSRKEIEQEKMHRLELERQRRQKLEITIPDEISVSELALRLKVQVSEVVKKLMMAGVMASASDVIDYDTAALAAMEIGAKVEHEVVVTIEDRLIDASEDEDDALLPRDPVVVVMGHVDHGKTSLLDAIRDADVAQGEAGGITQHIGAYRVSIGGRSITFLDTPGHAAFTSMRARGAQVTDIAVLVVAADDGIMPQTVEAINHAKAAGVSIIVAINKMDKPEANPDKVKQGLTEYGLVPEEWGGDTICVPVSARTHENIDTLLEMIQLVADVKELKANPDRLAKGTVIEARLDKGRGPISTVLIQNGTLHSGDVIIAGTAVGRVRLMLDDKGRRLSEAGPSVPVEITGLVEVPSAGDIFNAVEDEKLARQLVEQRKQEQKEAEFGSYTKVTLDNLFSQIEQGDMKELGIVVKADVQGSVEAVTQSLEKLSNDEVRVRVIHGAVGAISESDVMLAAASNAIIVGFNVRPDPVARDSADRDHVEIRLYRVIYDAIEEIEAAMKGLLAPKFREKQLGRAEVRQVYKISNVGTVAGCYVVEGKIVRNASIRVVRDGIVLAEDKLSGLRRFKDDVKEVAQGYECGMSLEKYADIHEGDILEAFEMEEYRD